MSDTEVIRSFLVELGFKTDEKSMKKFKDGVEGATAAVSKLVGAIAGAALTVSAGVAAFAANMEALYFSVQKMGASAINVKSFEKAMANFGVSSGEALQSVQSLARFMREEPGAEGFLASLGVDIRKANGELKDTSDLMVELGNALKDKPYYLARQYGNEFGIGEDTLRAMMNGDFAREMEKQRELLKDAGYDEATKNAHEFGVKLREIQTRIEAVGVVIGTHLIDAMNKLGPFILPILGKIAEGWKNIYDWVKAAGEAINNILPTSVSDKIGAGVSWLFDKLGIKGAVDSAMGLSDRSSPPATASGGSDESKQQRLTALEKKYGLPAGLLDRVWSAESGRGKHMRSPAGAQGHFQFMPDTAKQYGLANPDDFDQSPDASARYLRDLSAKYSGNMEKAVAAYNWGPGNVDRLGMSRAPAETRQYLDKVLGGTNGGSSGVQIAQNTTINVHGGDAAATGRSVANEQDRVNQNLTRNLQSPVR